MFTYSQIFHILRKKTFKNLIKEIDEASANCALSSSKIAARKLHLLMLKLRDQEIVRDEKLLWMLCGKNTAIVLEQGFYLLRRLILVLDYFEQRGCNKWDKKSEKYKKQWDEHKTTCYINDSGYSHSMETQGAIEKFYTLLIKWFAIHNICG